MSSPSSHGGFNPAKDIPDLSGRVCLITGANSGLGEATITALAQHNPKKLYLAARSRPKAEAAISRIRATSQAAKSVDIEILEIDLGSLDAVRAAATRFNSTAERLDILHLNGGIGMVPHGTTKDGYETQFGTNYLGHALLTQLLMPKLLETANLPGADVRIVTMSSITHKGMAPKEGILFDELKTPMERRGVHTLYGQSMLAKALFAYELAKKYPNIKSVSLHPGGVKTNAWDGDKGVNWLLYRLVVKPLVAMTAVSCEEGAKTQLWCSVSQDLKNGSYYEPIGLAGREGKLTYDDELSSKLWKWTDSELKSRGLSGWVTEI